MRAPKGRLGDVGVNFQGSSMEIIRYASAKDIDVRFENGYVATSKQYSKFINGSIKNNMIPNVYGFGFLGDGNHKSKENGKITCEYRSWVEMLKRCYDQEYKDRRPTYAGCTIREEWHNFHTFYEWYHQNKWTNDLRLSPDKDILTHGGEKKYSPNTVLLVDSRINSLFVKNDRNRGVLPIGVTKSNDKFRVRFNFNNKLSSFGLYDSIDEAFDVYKRSKEDYIKEVADEYRTTYCDFPKKLYDAMYSYEVNIDD